MTLALDPPSLELLPRNTRGWLYHLSFIGSMVASVIILMVVPYAYDQYNRSIYDDALAKNELIIQEFHAPYETLISAACSSATSCDAKTLLSALKTKKLIALDYVEQVERASKLGFFDFFKTIFFSVVALALSSALITLYVSLAHLRALFTVLSLVVVIGGVHLIGNLPHVNSKFYYSFGLLICLVICVSDYLNNVSLEYANRRHGQSRYKAIAYQEMHKKWTSILGYSLTLITVIVGTISFNTLGYIRHFFGDSFIVAPTIGIACGSAFLILIFAIGVIGNIRKILTEIETTIADLTD